MFSKVNVAIIVIVIIAMVLGTFFLVRHFTQSSSKGKHSSSNGKDTISDIMLGCWETYKSPEKGDVGEQIIIVKKPKSNTDFMVNVQGNNAYFFEITKTVTGLVGTFMPGGDPNPTPLSFQVVREKVKGKYVYTMTIADSKSTIVLKKECK